MCAMRFHLDARCMKMRRISAHNAFHVRTRVFVFAEQCALWISRQGMSMHSLAAAAFYYFQAKN
jgi:hypothetical protein